MNLSEILHNIILDFESLKEDGDILGFVNEKQKVFVSSDDSIKNKSYNEARLIRKKARQRIVMGSSMGRVVELRPVNYKNEIVTVAAIITKPSHVELAEKLVDELIRKWFDLAQKEEKENIEYKRDEEKLLKVEIIKKNSNEVKVKKKKTLDKKQVEKLLLDKDFNYIKAWLFVSPRANEEPFTADLKRLFPKAKIENTNNGVIILNNEEPNENLSSFASKYNCSIYSSFRFDENFKGQILNSLLSLTYTPDPIKKNGIISYEDNKDRASVILSYLNTPYLYYGEIKSLHLLKRNVGLYNTFMTFVRTHFNFNKTCEILKIHRNTAYNRLKIIADKFHSKSNDEAFFYHLYSIYVLSLAMEKNYLPDITSKDVHL